MLIANFSQLEWLSGILLFLLPVFTYLLLKKKKKMGGIKLPPSPPKLPIIGNLHLLGNFPHRSLEKLSKKHGPVMLLQLGRIPTVIVSSAKTAKQVLKTHDIDCCTRPASPGPNRFSYNGLDVVFASYGDYWKEMRKCFVSELLSMRRGRSFADAREAEVDKLITSLSQASPKPFNLDEKIFALADGIIGTVAFGKIYGKDEFQNQVFQNVLGEAMNMLASFSAEDFFPRIGRFIDALTGFHARLEKSFYELDAFLQMVLDQHLDPARPRPEHEDLVDFLIRLFKDQSSTFKVRENNVKAMLFDTFVGGIVTTSVTILWAMSELIKNPRVMNKVQAEIRNCIGRKAKVEGEDVAKLKYLKMVVKETFRLHPPLTMLLPREAMRHFKIGDYDILPKTRILVNVWAIGRDPNNWENPDEFYPERFEENDIDFKGSDFDLLPFGAGRRICPGLAMGATNVEFTLANLLHCFDWELPSGMKREDISMEEEGRLTYQRKIPLCLVPIRNNGQNLNSV
ncbi:Cytochrome P450, family 71, subfamily B, polypeptide 34, putative isoform 3 [Theobroma cacao]|nr:Cytochrome P450, family 71, subfamily B, polypeptide 34, putative isoform 3 [Theobroma cacao]